jgi:hypothetical protein
MVAAVPCPLVTKSLKDNLEKRMWKWENLLFIAN